MGRFLHKLVNSEGRLWLQLLEYFVAFGFRIHIADESSKVKYIPGDTWIFAKGHMQYSRA